MRLVATAILGTFLTLAAPSFAANTTPSVEISGNQVQASERPHISVNPQSLNVAIDRNAIAHLKVGQIVSISIAGEGSFSYVVEQLINDADILEIRGYLRGHPDREITLGLRPEGLSALIKTKERIYAIGYANHVQFVGEPGTKWMAKELAQQTPAMENKPTPIGGKPPVKGAQAVDLNLPLLASMTAGDGTVMQLPGLGYARVAFDEIRPGDGSSTWIGHLSDFGSTYKAILTYSPGGTVGTILTPAGEVNVTIGADGQQYSYNPTELGLTNGMQVGESCAALHEVNSSTLSAAATTQAATAATSTGETTAPVAKAGTATGSIIDVLVYYTPGMLTAYSNLAGVTARVDALIALANQAYATGKLPHQVRRVGLELLNVADTTSNSSLLSQMQTRSAPFTGMNAKRDAVGADLVTVLRPLYAGVQTSCGIGYVSGANGGNVSLYGDYGLSVVSDGVDRSGAPYYCANSTFAHELGHNMGLMHDRATTAKQGGGIGAKPYAFGYVPLSGKWGTIMSYTSPYIVTFSNPLDATCNTNELCGVSQASANSADNVAALGYTMPIIAGFRPTAAATDVFSVSGLITVNGVAVSGATLAVGNVTGGASTNVTCTASGTNGVYACSAPRGYAFQITPSYRVPSGAVVTWTPATAAFTAIASNQTSNFSGTSSDAKYVLTGVVTVNGTRTAGVVMNVSGTDAAKVSCQATTSAGAYSCSAPAGSTFTVAPSMKVAAGSTLTWSPSSTSVSKMAGNISLAFSAKLTTPKHTLTVITTMNGTKTLAVSLRISVSGNAGQVSCAAAADTTIKCQIPSNYAVTVRPLPTTSKMSFTPARMTLPSLPNDSTMTFVGKKM